jgi:hypothetical protein
VRTSIVLPRPGHAFEQRVAAREEAREHAVDDVVLADDVAGHAALREPIELLLGALARLAVLTRLAALARLPALAALAGATAIVAALATGALEHLAHVDHAAVGDAHLLSTLLPLGHLAQGLGGALEILGGHLALLAALLALVALVALLAFLPGVPLLAGLLAPLLVLRAALAAAELLELLGEPPQHVLRRVVEVVREPLELTLRLGHLVLARRVIELLEPPLGVLQPLAVLLREAVLLLALLLLQAIALLLEPVFLLLALALELLTELGEVLGELLLIGLLQGLVLELLRELLERLGRRLPVALFHRLEHRLQRLVRMLQLLGRLLQALLDRLGLVLVLGLPRLERFLQRGHARRRLLGGDAPLLQGADELVQVLEELLGARVGRGLRLRLEILRELLERGRVVGPHRHLQPLERRGLHDAREHLARLGPDRQLEREHRRPGEARRDRERDRPRPERGPLPRRRERRTRLAEHRQRVVDRRLLHRCALGQARERERRAEPRLEPAGRIERGRERDVRAAPQEPERDSDRRQRDRRDATHIDEVGRHEARLHQHDREREQGEPHRPEHEPEAQRGLGLEPPAEPSHHLVDRVDLHRPVCPMSVSGARARPQPETNRVAESSISRRQSLQPDGALGAQPGRAIGPGPSARGLETVPGTLIMRP